MNYERLRAEMVRRQLRWRGIESEEVLRAMGEVPRERFIAAEYREQAYEDRALPIGEGQTISQPFVVALMTAALDIGRGDKVLDVGTGSGYQAAILAEMGAKVFTVERHEVLAREATRRLENLGYDNVVVRSGDGSVGWAEEAPFAGILVAAAGPTIPTPLLKQLQVRRHLVLPVARGVLTQDLVRITKKGRGRYSRKELGQVAFVRLIGEEGWSDDSEGWRWV